MESDAAISEVRPSERVRSLEFGLQDMSTGGWKGGMHMAILHFWGVGIETEIS